MITSRTSFCTEQHVPRPENVREQAVWDTAFAASRSAEVWNTNDISVSVRVANQVLHDWRCVYL